MSIFNVSGILAIHASCSERGVQCNLDAQKLYVDCHEQQKLQDVASTNSNSEDHKSKQHEWISTGNGWFYCSPFNVHCDNVDIENIRNDLDNIYNCYADCVKDECKDNDGNIVDNDNKIIIDVSKLTQPSDDTYEERQEELEISTTSYVRYLNTNNIPLTVDVLEELIEAIAGTSGHDWVFNGFSRLTGRYLHHTGIINGQARVIHKFLSDRLWSYLESIINIASRYKDISLYEKQA